MQLTLGPHNLMITRLLPDQRVMLMKMKIIGYSIGQEAACGKLVNGSWPELANVSKNYIFGFSIFLCFATNTHTPSNSRVSPHHNPLVVPEDTDLVPS